MRSSERMLSALRERGLDVPEGSVIQRTYAGRHQRAEGSWTWFVLTPAGDGVIGSQWPLAELLRGAASRRAATDTGRRTSTRFLTFDLEGGP